MKDINRSFEDEVFFTLKRQRNTWSMVAMGCLLLACLSVLAVVVLVPLKETRPFVVLVDKTTGEAEKVVEIRPMTLSERDAVLQAELVSYITDRETYDMADNTLRVPEVLSLSTGQAADSLKALWTREHPQYPPTVYGDKARVTVRVKSISLLPQVSGAEFDLARVRIEKVREQYGHDPVSRSFEVTVGFRFEPQATAKLEDVWRNPLGFTVGSYRLDVESTTSPGVRR